MGARIKSRGGRACRVNELSGAFEGRPRNYSSTKNVVSTQRPNATSRQFYNSPRCHNGVGLAGLQDVLPVQAVYPERGLWFKLQEFCFESFHRSKTPTIVGGQQSSEAIQALDRDIDRIYRDVRRGGTFFRGSVGI